MHTYAITKPGAGWILGDEETFAETIEDAIAEAVAIHDAKSIDEVRFVVAELTIVDGRGVWIATNREIDREPYREAFEAALAKADANAEGEAAYRNHTAPF